MPRRQEIILRDMTRRTWGGRFAQLWDNMRSLVLGPFNPRDPTIARLFSASGPVSSGVHVTFETAMMVSAVYAAIRTIADDVASLPLCLFRRLPGGGKARFEGHYLYRLLHDQPNPENTSHTFIQTLVFQLLLGNAYAEIVRDGAGRPAELWPLAARRVTPFRDHGVLRYRVSNEGAQPDIVLDARDMIHVGGLTADGVVGFDTIVLAREVLGLAIASEKYAATFFGNGAAVGGVLSVGDGVTTQALENIRKAFDARHTGVDRAHRVFVAPSGSKFETTNVTPHDGQLADLREYQLGEVARFFKIPPAFIGSLGRATWGNFSEQRLQYFTQTILPLLHNIESELEMKLVAPLQRSQQLVEFVSDGFLRGTPEQRATFYKTMIEAGVMTADEARERENLPPLSAPAVPTADGQAAAATPTAIRSAIVLSAHRDMLALEFSRQLSREINKADKCKGAGPQKLRLQVETYYGDDYYRTMWKESVRPVVRAWLMVANATADVDELVDLLTARHYAESKRDLLRIVEAIATSRETHVDDSELFDKALTQLLERWKASRAEQFADYVIQHALTEDGQIADELRQPISDEKPAIGKTSGMSIRMRERMLKNAMARG
jgi:HK97 family phage portal protein